MPPVAVERLKMTPDLPRPATKENLAAPDRDLAEICRFKDMKTEMPARWPLHVSLSIRGIASHLAVLSKELSRPWMDIGTIKTRPGRPDDPKRSRLDEGTVGNY
jgi:hypothetical protein